MPFDLTIATSYDHGSIGLPPASEPVFVSPRFLDNVASTVAPRPAETGGLSFGPYDRHGCDTFAFDQAGSAAATSVMYMPNTKWANALQDEYARARPSRCWDGAVHSHPEGYTRPSGIHSAGKSDMTFARAALAANDHMTRCLLFIVTGASTSRPVLWPWVVERDDPDLPHFAPVVVADVRQFPPRRFPPGFEEQTEEHVAVPLVVALQVAHLREVARCDVTVRNRVIAAQARGLTIELHLPCDFPQASPTVAVITHGTTRVLSPNWRAQSRDAIEVRLGRLIRAVRHLAKEQ